MKKIHSLVVLLATLVLYCQNYDSLHWSGRLLQGRVIGIDLENRTKDSLENAYVLLLKTEGDAISIKDKFENLNDLYDSITVKMKDSTKTADFSRIGDLINNFTKSVSNIDNTQIISELAEDLKQNINNIESVKILIKIISKNLYSLLVKDKPQAFLSVAGAVTNDNGEFSIKPWKKDQREDCRYLLSGLLGYKMAIFKLDTLKTVVTLQQRELVMPEVGITVKAGTPYTTEYYFKPFPISHAPLQTEHFDCYPYLSKYLKPTDLSVGILDYSWYYTYSTYAFVAEWFNKDLKEN